MLKANYFSQFQVIRKLCILRLLWKGTNKFEHVCILILPYWKEAYKADINALSFLSTMT